MNEQQIKMERDSALKLKGSYEEGLRQNAKVVSEFEDLYKNFTPELVDALTKAGIDMTFLVAVDKERLQTDQNYLKKFKEDLYETANKVKNLANKS